MQELCWAPPQNQVANQHLEPLPADNDFPWLLRDLGRVSNLLLVWIMNVMSTQISLMFWAVSCNNKAMSPSSMGLTFKLCCPSCKVSTFWFLLSNTNKMFAFFIRYSSHLSSTMVTHTHLSLLPTMRVSFQYRIQQRGAGGPEEWDTDKVCPYRIPIFLVHTHYEYTCRTSIHHHLGTRKPQNDIRKRSPGNVELCSRCSSWSPVVCGLNYWPP